MYRTVPYGTLPYDTVLDNTVQTLERRGAALLGYGTTMIGAKRREKNVVTTTAPRA